VKESLNYFFNPSSVAVVGVTRNSGPNKYNILEIILWMGYKGKIYPVNPKVPEIVGLKSYPSVLDIPGPVDLAVIITSRTVILEVVRQCVEKRVKGILIVSQGFADADSEGKEIQNKIMNIVAGTGIRVMGPNTLGVINNFDKFITSFVRFKTSLSPVGIISQTGMFIAGSNDICYGCGYAADVGNAADIGFKELMEYYNKEDGIKLINMHIEGIQDGREFLNLSRAITPKKPIIAYKTGRSQEGALAIGSHSASLAGEDHVYDAVFRQAGIIRAESLNDLRDFNKAFIKYSHVRGNRVGVLSITGAGGITTLDALAKCNLVPARLSPETISEIDKLYPDWMQVTHPVDCWAAAMMHGFDKVYPQILRLMLNDPGVDILVLVLGNSLPPGAEYGLKFDCILDVARECPDKLMVAWNFGVNKYKWAEYLEEQGPLAVYDSPERMARAMGVLYHYYHHIRMRKNEPIQVSTPVPPAVDAKGMTGAVPTDKAMEILAGAGIPVVKDIFVRSPEEATNAAAALGYPVALKVVSPQVLHKTEVGGVRLNIRDSEELKKSYLSMLKEVQEKSPGASIQGFLVQRCLSGGIELILGSKQDATFGPVLVFGMGGIYTEILQDVAFRIAPVSSADALEMIGETRVSQLLQGVRGQEKADLDALVKAITSLSDLVVNNPEIKEVDINPLLASSKGVVALDGRIIF
jgi:acyl-CoA synthetase (NDP forming)